LYSIAGDLLIPSDLSLCIPSQVTIASWAPGGARHTRLAYDDTRIVSGSLGGGVLVADIL
jgi:hypothetical protein